MVAAYSANLLALSKNVASEVCDVTTRYTTPPYKTISPGL
jgi:hypothetical protein